MSSPLSLAPRWRKVLRDVWSQKTRTLLVVVSIAVGVFAVGTTLTIQDVLARELQRNWQASRPASGSISIQAFEEDFVRSVRQMPQIADAEGRASLNARVQVAGKADETRQIELIALPDFDNIRLNRIDKADVTAANWPPPKREVLLGTNSLALLNIRVGDSITLRLPGNKTQIVRVAGTVRNVDEGGGPFVYAAMGFITFDTLEWLGQGRKYQTLYFRVTERLEDRGYIQSVADTLKQRVERDGRTFYAFGIPQHPNQHPNADVVTGVVGLMTVIGIVSLVLSAFLVINTISAVLAQHVRQIGIMKAVGARAGQLAGMYFGMVLTFGALSLVVALPLGVLGADAFVRYMGETLLNLHIVNTFPPSNVFILQCGIALIAPLVAALAPVLGGTRKTVHEAISDYGIENSTHGRNSHNDRKLSRKNMAPLPLWVRALSSRPLLITLRNTFRRKGRLVLTMIVLVLGGAIFIGVMCGREGLLRTLDVSLAYWGFDFDVNLSNAYPLATVSDAAQAVPGVKRVEAWGWASARQVKDDRTDGLGFVISAPPADTTMLKPILLRGRWITLDDTDAIVLNTYAVERLPGVKVGDMIHVKLDGSQRAQLRVVGVVQGVLTNAIGYMNRTGLMRVAQLGNKVSYLAVQTDSVDPIRNAAIAYDLEERFKRSNIQVAGTSQTSQTRTSLLAQFDIVIYVLLAMAILLAVVGGLGLAGTMSINVLERTREIGVMRAIGASNSAIRRIVVIEGVLIGVMSWVIAAVLAIPVSYGIVALLSAALQFEVFYAFSSTAMLFWLGAVSSIAALASVLPAWSASRLTVREVLVY